MAIGAAPVRPSPVPAYETQWRLVSLLLSSGRTHSTRPGEGSRRKRGKPAGFGVRDVSQLTLESGSTSIQRWIQPSDNQDRCRSAQVVFRSISRLFRNRTSPDTFPLRDGRARSIKAPSAGHTPRRRPGSPGRGVAKASRLGSLDASFRALGLTSNWSLVGSKHYRTEPGGNREKGRRKKMIDKPRRRTRITAPQGRQALPSVLEN